MISVHLREKESAEVISRIRERDAGTSETVFSADDSLGQACRDRRSLLILMDQKAEKVTTDWPREVTAILDGLGDQAVRVCEGGGPENLAMSLAVTVAKLARKGV